MTGCILAHIPLMKGAGRWGWELSSSALCTPLGKRKPEPVVSLAYLTRRRGGGHPPPGESSSASSQPPLLHALGVEAQRRGSLATLCLVLISCPTLSLINHHIEVLQDWIDQCKVALMQREQHFLCAGFMLISSRKPVGPTSII